MLLAPQPLALFLLPALHALGCHQHLYLGLPTVVRTNLNMMVKISHATGSAVLFFSRSEAFYGSMWLYLLFLLWYGMVVFTILKNRFSESA